MDDELTIGPTVAGTRPTPVPTPLAAMPRAHGPSRYAPGAIVAGRYRLVALLGRGGMGEVYRADDLTLDQPVALKFLTTDLDVVAGAVGGEGTSAAARLAQFHNELRVARQVSHKNVCRLYDLGEADGRRFLTMEYVDGEDLAALLRRIGRFPQDRAVAIARQLCAGVSAAHERGVIHRDLKPANVMIDGEGNVRITDFGIATALQDTTAGFAGTPQYMAPEQLTGTAASVKTDLYALGLILFEVFTGKRAHDGKTIADLRALHDTGTITTPSSIVRDLDPAIERVILRCLDKDPDRRPASALAVAAALPGGDPLAEALAAGETPSPQLLAAAAETDAVPAWKGLLAIVWVVAALTAASFLAPRATLARLVPLDKAPAVLADRADQILTSLGFTEPRGDRAEGFQSSADYIAWIARTDSSAGRWTRLASGSPPALLYWYRTSPREMLPRQLSLRVTPNDPVPNDTNMHMVVLDTRGRLVQLTSVPAQFDPDTTESTRPAPWRKLFEAAGLSIDAFTPVPPQWTPRDFADVRAAWEGPLSDAPPQRVRIEAAAYRGQPVSFTIIGPWSRPTRMQPLTRSTIDRIANVVVTLGAAVVLVVAILMARQNVALRRADVRGATRLAVAAFAIEMTSWLFGYQHRNDFRAEILSMSAVSADAVFVGMLQWVLYAALEPYCRRFWPVILLGWSRLIAGHLRDSRVGRDLLVGVSAGVLWLLVDLARRLLPQALGYAAVTPRIGGELNFVGAPCDVCNAVSTWSVLFIRQLTPAFTSVLIFVLLRLITRRQWAAIGLGALAIFAWWSALANPPAFWIELVAELLIVVLFTAVVIRFGVLAALVSFFVLAVCSVAPLTADITHWSATLSNLTMALVLGLTLFAFVASRAGQPLFGSVLSTE